MRVALTAALPEADVDELVHAASASNDATTTSVQPDAVWACMIFGLPILQRMQSVRWRFGGTANPRGTIGSIRQQDRVVIANFGLTPCANYTYRRAITVAGVAPS
jgi:hypothetical protein